MCDNFNVNLRKNEGFLTYIPCIPIPEYGQSNTPLKSTYVVLFEETGRWNFPIQRYQIMLEILSKIFKIQQNL